MHHSRPEYDAAQEDWQLQVSPCRFTEQFWLLWTIWTTRRDDWCYRNPLQYWDQKINVGMLLCIVMLLPIFGRGSSEFSGYCRDFCLSLFPWLTLCYPASLLEDQDFTPWGRQHWSTPIGPSPFPRFPKLCNSCSTTVLSSTPNSFYSLTRNVAGWEEYKGSPVSPSCSSHVGLVVVPCCKGSVPHCSHPYSGDKEAKWSGERPAPACVCRRQILGGICS